MWRNGPLHFNQKGKCETHEELNSSHFSIIRAAGASLHASSLDCTLTHRLSSHLERGKPCHGAEFNVMSCYC